MTEQEPAAPQTAEVDVNKLLSLVEKLLARNTTSPDDMARVSAEAAINAAKVLRDQWWDEKTYPHISGMNPLGEKDHPRPDLVRDFIFGGLRVQKQELTAQEIELFNRLVPGLYHGGQWQVINHEPGAPHSRLYEVKFPYQDPAARANLPSSLVAMLQEMVEGGPVPA